MNFFCPSEDEEEGNDRTVPAKGQFSYGNLENELEADQVTSAASTTPSGVKIDIPEDPLPRTGNDVSDPRPHFSPTDGDPSAILTGCDTSGHQMDGHMTQPHCIDGTQVPTVTQSVN